MDRTVPHDVISAFYEFDSDGNGFIDPEELKQVLGKLGFDDNTIDQLFKEADVNKDGKLSYNEFLGWMFDNPDAKCVREALNKERMSRIGAALLATPLPCMKANVDTAAFNEAVLRLLRDHTVEVTGATTLASAHALLSVDESYIPQELKIEGTPDALLTPDQAAPLVYAALVAGCKSITVGGVKWGEKLTDACFHGLEQSRSETFSTRGVQIDDDDDIADIFGGIGKDSRLHTMDLSGSVAGSKALEELLAALDRSQMLKTVALTVAADVKASELLSKIRATLEKRTGSLVV